MNKFLAMLTVLSLVAMTSLGCGQATTPEPTDLTKVLYRPGTLCGNCGQLKGTETCCAEGAEVCSKCSLHKGAPGCCKMEKGANVTLCGACGEIKGGAACCAEGAEACAKCKLNKGAPGCCKLERIDADANLEHVEEDHDGNEQHAEGEGHDDDAGHSDGHDNHEGHDADEETAA